MANPDHYSPSGIIPDPLPIWFGTRILNKLHSLYLRIACPFAGFGEHVSVHFTCSIRNPRLIKLGNQIIVQQFTWLHGVQPTEDKVEPTLVIEDRCAIGSFCQISARNSIHIEQDVLVAGRVVIMDHNHAYKNVNVPIKDQGLTSGGRIRIGHGSWIGAGATILCDSGELTIGHGCVIGANALVTRSFPPYSVVFGNPAVVLQQYDPVKETWVMGPVRSAESTAKTTSISKVPGIPGRGF